MKNILVVLFSLFLFSLSAQSFTNLIHEYEKECAQLVPDTMEQEGFIEYDLVPVLKDGAIVGYGLGNPDTVWMDVKCPEFKNSKQFGFLTMQGYTSPGITLTPMTDNVYRFSTNQPLRGTEKMGKQKIEITRKYVCMVKLREVEPFSEHFWNWLKNK